MASKIFERNAASWTSVPDWLMERTALTRLSLRNNNIPVLPRSLGTLTNLQQLDMASNELISIPHEIGYLFHLQSLLLDGNRLTTLPKTMAFCTSLRVLTLPSNRLTGLPTWLPDLRHLQRLDLANNKLTQIPPGEIDPAPPGHGPMDALWSVFSLQNLKLDGNDLGGIPRHVGLLNQLTQLSCCNVGAARIPRHVFALTHLKVLKLSRNSITSIPEQVGGLQNLEQLELSDTGLNDLPALMCKCTRLQTLSLIRCELAWPLDTLAEKGAQQVVQYLEDRYASEKVAKPQHSGVSLQSQLLRQQTLHQLVENPFDKGNGVDRRHAAAAEKMIRSPSQYFSMRNSSSKKLLEIGRPGKFDLPKDI